MQLRIAVLLLLLCTTVSGFVAPLASRSLRTRTPLAMADDTFRSRESVRVLQGVGTDHTDAGRLKAGPKGERTKLEGLEAKGYEPIRRLGP